MINEILAKNLKVEFLRKIEGFVKIDVDEIDVPEDLPIRMHSPEEFSKLKQSISEEGIIVPIVVVRDKETDRYVLVDGRNRLKAARELGMTEIPAIVYHSVLGKEEVPRLALEVELFKRHLSEKELNSLFKFWTNERNKVENAKGKLWEEYYKMLGSLFEKENFQGEEADATQKEYEEKMRQLVQEKEELQEKIMILQEQVNRLKEELEEVKNQPQSYVEDALNEVPEEVLQEKIREVERKMYEKIREVELKLVEARKNLENKEREITLLKNEVKFVEQNRDHVREILKKVCNVQTIFNHFDTIEKTINSLDGFISGIIETGKFMYEDEWNAILARASNVTEMWNRTVNQLKEYSKIASLPRYEELSQDDLKKDAEELGVSAELLSDWGGTETGVRKTQKMGR